MQVQGEGSDHSTNRQVDVQIVLAQGQFIPYYNETLQSDWSVLDCLFHVLPHEHLLHLLPTFITLPANTYYT